MTKPTKFECEEDGSFILKIDDHVPDVDTAKYSIKDIESFKPADYFITSGDAVTKASYMHRQFTERLVIARKLYGKQGAKRKKMILKMAEATKAAAKLVILLKQIRGENVFLETEYRDHVLYCLPKNPRIKDDLG